MQKCSTDADMKIDKKSIENSKKYICDGNSCRPLYDTSSEQFKEKKAEGISLNINLLTDESENHW